MSNLAELLAASGLQRRDDHVVHLGDGTPSIYLHAGHLHVSAEPVQITTIVGPCVAICVWDPVAGIGGMNHYMLSDDIGVWVETPRHANFAIRTLLEQLQSLGAHRKRSWQRCTEARR